MADTEILKRAEKYIKSKGQTLNKYDLVGFANAEHKLLSKHILELQQTNGALTDKVNELEKRFEPQAFTEVMREIEENYNNKVRLTKAKELLKKYMKISEENGRQFDEEVYFEAREFLKE